MSFLNSRASRRKMAAVAFSILAGAAAMTLAVTEQRAGRIHSPPPVVRAAPMDPLAAEFAHCQALGEAGARDPGCLAAWAHSRSRFLTLRQAVPDNLSAPPVRPQVGGPEDE